MLRTTHPRFAAESISLMRAFATAFVIIALAGSPAAVHAVTHVFGEDGNNLDLTGPSNIGDPNGVWTSADQFIIAGDGCYVPSGATLTIGAGTTVTFDWDFGGDNTGYPLVHIYGTLDINGTSANPVTITDAAVVDGLYEGFVIDDDGAGSVGTIDAEWAVFRYGGRTSALINIEDDDATVVLRNVTVELSDTDGIYIGGDDTDVRLYDCIIRNNEGYGIVTSNGANGNDEPLIISGCAVYSNGDTGIDLARRSHQYQITQCRVYDNLNNGISVNGDGTGGGGYGFIRNNLIWGNDNGIVFAGQTTTSTLAGAQYEVLNNAVYDNDFDGLRVVDLDYSSGNRYLKISARNNIFWGNVNGLVIGGWTDSVWPSSDRQGATYYLDLLYNIFGNSAHDGLEVATGGNSPPVPAPNAFQDYVTNVSIANCIVDTGYGGNDVVSLVSESPTYDFHLQWDGLCDLSSVSSAAQDFDGTDVNCGIYGGQFGAENIDQSGNAVDGYVKLGSGNITGVIAADTYYMLSDFTVPNVGNYSGPEITIEPEVDVVVKGNYRFNVYGTVYCNPNAEPGDIRFSYGGAAGGWQGIMMDGSPTFGRDISGSAVRDLVVEGTSSNYAGLHVRMNNGDDVTVDNVLIQDCGVGLFVYYAAATLSDVEVIGCTYENAYVVTSALGQVNVRQLISRDNAGTQAFSSGLRLNSADPAFGTGQGLESHLYDNGKWGMHADDSSPDMADRDSIPTINIFNNGNSQIFLMDNSDPEFHFNDVEPPVDGNGTPTEWAVEFGAGQNIVWDAEDNWWGTDVDDDPADGRLDLEDSLFEVLNLIDYVPWSADPNIANPASVSDFEVARGLIREGRWADAIVYLKAAAADGSAGGRRWTALRWLRGCYKEGRQDIGELRDWYRSFALDCDDAELAFKAESEAIMTLFDQERYAECAQAFRARRQAVETIADSVRNEKALILAELATQDDNEVNAVGGDPHLVRLHDEWAALDALLEKSLLGESGAALPARFAIRSVHPNPFNGRTVVAFDLVDDGRAAVGVFDLTGRHIITLADGEFKAGRHSVVWNASDMPAGAYMLKVAGPGGVRAVKLALVK